MKLFDGHCDTAFELWKRGEGLRANSCHIDLQKAKRLDAYAQVFAFCSYAGTDMFVRPQDALDLPLAVLRRELSENSAQIAFAANAAEVRALWRQEKAAALLSLEGPESIGCDPERLFSLEGFVMTTLTWNADNALAGCHLGDKGLTDRGRAFVSAAEECGIRIDVSHLSDRAFWDLCEIVHKPILASHSNCRALCAHSRNLPDDQLRAVAQLGGTVGLNLYVPFLGENADFAALRSHLEHLLTVCGESHVALGGDLDGCDTLGGGITGVQDYPKLYAAIKARGYDAALLQDLFADNWLRVLPK